MFNALLFLRENFQTPQNVHAKFLAYEMEAPTLPAIEKWFQRGAIPGSCLPHLLCILELETGEPVRIAKYFGVRKDD
jgi:hypothetical protein